MGGMKLKNSLRMANNVQYIHLKHFSLDYNYPPPPNKTLIQPTFYTCPLLYLFINFIPSPLFLFSTHNCVTTIPIFLVATKKNIFVFFFIRD
jgi:hypothetical protein